MRYEKPPIVFDAVEMKPEEVKTGRIEMLSGEAEYCSGRVSHVRKAGASKATRPIEALANKWGPITSAGTSYTE